MLKTRLWMGTILIVLGVGILQESQWFGQWFPLLGLVLLLVINLSYIELISLSAPEMAPNRLLGILALTTILAMNWINPILQLFGLMNPSIELTWKGILYTSLLFIFIAFLREMIFYVNPSPAPHRIASLLFSLFYLGILPSFFIQLRFYDLYHPNDRGYSQVLVALTLFVPKFGDIGAYFTGKFLTGRVLGRHLMTPKLSPKKTFQGGIAGLIVSVLTTVIICRYASDCPALCPQGTWQAIILGLLLGSAGILGDLAESLIKRCSEKKDASNSIPGFGGILDVIDSLLFTAPIAYFWVYGL